MYNRFFKKTLIYIFFLLLIGLVIITLNNSFRKSILNAIINSYKIYMLVSIQGYLKTPEPDYVLLNNKLLNFIENSKKISSGKSRLLIGIYDAANLVQSSIIDDKKFGQLEEFFSEFSNLDPDLYEVKIWHAKSLYANNKIEDSLKEIDKAIKLSPLDHEPYRLALNIFSRQNDLKKFNYYCKKFLQAELGGKEKRYYFTKFEGINFNDFAIRLGSPNNEDKNDYIIRGINNGKFDQYEIIPEKPVNISLISMIFNFNPGTVLEIDNLKLFSKSDFFTIDGKDLIILSRNAFFINSNTQKQVILTSNNTEILNLNLNKEFENIDKIILKIKFDKMDLVNKNCK